MGDEAGVEATMLAEARVEVSYADHKASMVLAALGIGFGAVLGGLLAGDWEPADQGDGTAAWWIAAALAFGAVVTAGAAVWPRYPRRPGKNLDYWGDIARLPTYEMFVRRLSDEGLSDVERTRRQLWTLSQIVATKYLLIRVSLSAAALAVIAFGVSALMV